MCMFNPVACALGDLRLEAALAPEGATKAFRTLTCSNTEAAPSSPAASAAHDSVPFLTAWTGRWAASDACATDCRIVGFAI